MIPVKFLRKMGVYNLNLNGVTVKAKVVDNEELIKDGITELRNKLDPNFPIVGLDLKCSSDQSICPWEEQFFYPKLLVLYVKYQCLLIQLGRLSAFPDSLLSFLNDREICFLRLQDSRRLISSLDEEVVPGHSVLKTGVDVGTFAARVLNNRDLEDCTDLVELATKAGFSVKQQASQATAASQRPVKPLWGALCFTKEEVKYALKDACDCYNLGIKLKTVLKINYISSKYSGCYINCNYNQVNE